ncbi:MAG: hypothetical protein NVSMB32_03930 [Actinomycetota bacterium]
MGQTLVVLDATNGHVVRTLATLGQLGDNASALASFQGIAVSPDGATVYFTETSVGASCTEAIKKVPAAGGPPATVVAGNSPAISRDGLRLAYVVGDCGSLPAGATGPQVRVAELASPTATTSSFAADPADQTPPSPSVLTWSPDGTRLGVVEVSQQLGAATLHGLDLAHNATYDPSPTLGPPATAPAGTSWPVAAYLPDGRLLVGQTCCDTGGGTAPSTGAVLIVGPDGTLAQTVTATQAVTSVAADRSANRLFWVTAGTLWTSVAGSPPKAIAHGVAAVAD